MSSEKHSLPSAKSISRLAKQCVREDLGSGDLTARLTPRKQRIEGKIIAREEGVFCGSTWASEVFSIVAKRHRTQINIEWLVKDGNRVITDQSLCRFDGYAHPILSAERSALNLLQTLSGTATQTRQYVDAIAHTKAKLLDTRKTLPGMRQAQKYAVLCGGGVNHRFGLYDGIIIKENHLRTGKSLERLVADANASMPTGGLVELEVESLEELDRGLKAGAKRIMLDDFSLQDMRMAVELTANRAQLEASGGVNLKRIETIAETGVDYISCGAITKHVRALDLSMLFNFT